MDNNPHLPGTADEFIENNLGLARKEAWRFIKWISRDEEIKFDKDDLLSIAYMGLVKAYQKFDPTRFTGKNGGQIKFSTYAVPMINRELRRHIRDLGHTVRRSRDGRGINNIDSLDRELKDDENSSQTIGDTIKVESYEIEYQAIINDFVLQLDPRLQKTYKLLTLGKTQGEIGKYLRLSQVQAGRMVNKLLDLAKQYGERGNEDMGREMSPETKLMREEVDTFAKFGAIGSYEDVASKYGVGKGTAYSWMRKLMDEGVVKEVREVAEIKEAKMETAPFEIPNTPGNYKAIDKLVEGTEALSEASKEDEGGIVTGGGKEESVDCFGKYEDNRYDSCEDCDACENCKLVTIEILRKNKNSNDSEPCESLLCHSCEEGKCIAEDTSKHAKNNKNYGCFGEYDANYSACSSCEQADECHQKTHVLAYREVSCVTQETKDDLEGLAEPEPEWDKQWADRVEDVIDDIDNNLKSAIEKMWSVLKQDVGIIHKMHIAQAEQEFSERLNQILGGR